MTPAGGAHVAVVGAGPAGSSVALRLARRGARVALLDATGFPRSKPCGDCLSPGATPLLRELGLRDRVERTGAGELSGWRVRTPAGTWFDGRFGEIAGPGRERRDRPSPEPDDAPGPRGARRDRPPCTGYALPRRELDAVVARAAVDAGADFREGVRVYGLLRRNGRVAGVEARDGEGRTVRIGADVVVGADGLRSVVARRLAGIERGPNPRLALVARLRGVDPPGCGARRDRSRDGRGGGAPRGEMRLRADGCLGLAPLGGGRWNATLVVPAARAPAISAHRRRFFRRALDAYGVRRRFRRAELLAPLEITGPFRIRPRRRAAPGVLLAGDAAGYFDPLTGQGVHRALATGRAAAHAAGALLEADGPGRRGAVRRRYRLELRRLLSPGRALQGVIDAVCRRGALIEALGALMAERPRLADLFVDVTGDRAGPAALLDPRRLAAALLSPGAAARRGPPGGGRDGAPPASRH